MARQNLLKGFSKPKGLSFEMQDETPNYGRFMAQPFERGYGTTIGNSLRRILLSSIQGCAISAIRITTYNKEGVPKVLTSEYELITNVTEDTSEIINNLKQLQIQLAEDIEQKTIFIEYSNKTELRGTDFEVDNDVKILNPELLILHSMSDVKLDIEVQIDLGRGYVPAEINEKYINEIGTIPMDALYSPIRRVAYSTTNTRVGDRTDYDKLTIEIWTNGSIRPEDALAEAAKIAKEHFTIFINFNENELTEEKTEDNSNYRIQQLLNTSVDELELSVRSNNCLKNANIRTIRDIVSKTEDEITKTRNFGKKSMQEIKEKLQEWNLRIGMTDYSTVKYVHAKNNEITENQE